VGDGTTERDIALTYADYFSIAFPAGGLWALAAAAASMRPGTSFLFITSTELIFGVCSVLRSMPITLQCITFVALVICRTHVWVTSSELVGKLFEPKVFGLAYGFVCGCAGVVNLLNLLFIYARFDFFWMNIALCVVCTIAGVFMLLFSVCRGFDDRVAS
jgi:hypothetical protein